MPSSWPTGYRQPSGTNPHFNPSFDPRGAFNPSGNGGVPANDNWMSPANDNSPFTPSPDGEAIRNYARQAMQTERLGLAVRLFRAGAGRLGPLGAAQLAWDIGRILFGPDGFPIAGPVPRIGPLAGGAGGSEFCPSGGSGIPDGYFWISHTPSWVPNGTSMAAVCQVTGHGGPLPNPMKPVVPGFMGAIYEINVQNYVGSSWSQSVRMYTVAVPKGNSVYPLLNTGVPQYIPNVGVGRRLNPLTDPAGIPKPGYSPARAIYAPLPGYRGLRDARQVGTVLPRETPLGRLGTRTEWKSDAPPKVSPGVSPRNPPKKGTKERKLTASVQGTSVGKIVNAVTEYTDFINALFQALPKNVKREALKKPLTVQRVSYYVYRHFGEIDLQSAIINLAQNEVEDRAIGGLSRRVQKASHKHLKMLNRPVGWSTGRAL